MRALIAILAVVVVVGVCQGRIITVDDDGPPADFDNIQDAIDDANDGDTIIVADGVYLGHHNRDFKGKAITVRSEKGPENCIIDGQKAGRGFWFHSGEGPDSVLDGLTMMNCYGYADPLGYWCGGAIRCKASSPTIRNCIFSDNKAPLGPGYPGSIGTDGGAIYCYRSSAVIEDCVFLHNTASGTGGAIHCGRGSVVVRDCVLMGNHAYGGGAIRLNDDNSRIENCLIAHNIAQNGFGGGIYSAISKPRIANCTLCSNSAALNGGGLHSGGATTAVESCIFRGNIAPADPEISGTAVISYSNVEGGYLGSGNMDADPCFADPDNGDYHLKSQAGRWDANSEAWVKDDVTSPCIDTGDPMTPIGDEPFPNGGIINMGAYGGTAQASKSYFGEPPCETIVAGDINGDCKVNFLDFVLMALHWLEDHNP